MPESSETLFDRIGGEATVADMIDQFYGRVLGDPELRPFFDGASLEKLKRMQREFFAVALDGPLTTGGSDIARIHQGRGITRRHLTAFVNHLIATLEAYDTISRRDSMDIVFRIATFSDQVIGESSGADG